jgi:hypothetical protein
MVRRAIGIEAAPPRIVVSFITIVRWARFGAAIGSGARRAVVAIFPVIFGKVGLAHPVPAEFVTFRHAAEFTTFLVAVVLAVENGYALDLGLAVFETKKRIPALRRPFCWVRRRDLFRRRGVRRGRRRSFWLCRLSRHGRMTTRPGGPWDRRGNDWLRHDQFVAAAIETDAAVHLDVFSPAAFYRMRVDVEPTGNAPSMKDAIVKEATGKEVLLFVGKVTRRHEPAREVEHPLAGDLAAIVAALFVVVHNHLFM